MALFKYTALNEKGRKIGGFIDAESLLEAKQKLIRRQILVTQVKEAVKKKSGCALKKSEILMLTRELARLLEAGLPLFEALSVLEEKYRDQKAHELLLDLCDKIRTGQPLSQALEEHPASFDRLYSSMIANAERGGHLVKSLHELAHLIERQLHVRKAILGALLYPALLGCFCLVVLSVLLFFVVPSLFDLFEGRSLHPFTSFVFTCSRFALKGKWFLAGMSGSLLGALFWSVWTKKGKAAMQRAVIRMPFLSDLLAKVALTRFFRAAAAMIEGGLPALFALQQAAVTLRHPLLEQSMKEAIQSLSEGETLQKALEGRAMIPPLVPRMLGIALEGGKLSVMMHQIATIYEEDLEKTIEQITTLAQPILLLVLGAMVGFVLLSVLLPLTDVSSFAT
jgi:general secretion pathway protein F/type IV pilus assembly protein PilC